MPLRFIRNDITKVKTQAVVLPANEYLIKGPGASTAIFTAAGEEKLEKKCREIGYLPMGEAAVTEGFGLDAEYIIHATVPLWQGGTCNEEEHLRNAYRNSLTKAEETNIASIAFPLLASGSFGYPKDMALEIAVDEISFFLENSDMEVQIVLYGDDDLSVAAPLTDSIDEYIDNNYVEEQKRTTYRMLRKTLCNFDNELPEIENKSIIDSVECTCIIDIEDVGEKNFADTLLDLIDNRGMTDPQAYHASNIDRKLFNKIKNSSGYTPKKSTALSFCIGLRLSLSEAEDLLSRAGYAFSPCSKFDLVIKYFIETGDYRTIHDVNMALFDRALPTLG